VPFMRPGSIVPKSRQGWKLVAGIVGNWLGAAALWWGLREDKPRFGFGGLLLALVAMVSVAIAIRCRRCGARWLWMAVSTQPDLQWWKWLVAQEVCPKCGHDPGAPAKPAEAH
jgi:hypothetical protein